MTNLLKIFQVLVMVSILVLCHPVTVKADDNTTNQCRRLSPSKSPEPGGR